MLWHVHDQMDVKLNFGKYYSRKLAKWAYERFIHYAEKMKYSVKPLVCQRIEAGTPGVNIGFNTSRHADALESQRLT